MNEMLTFPFMVAIILGTAVLSSIITTSLPSLGRWFNAFKNAIKRKLTRKPKPAVYCDDLQSQIDELKEQVNNVATNHYRRETNRKNNIRRAVREYLEELKNG